MTEEKPIWDELPEPLPVGWAETLYYSKPDMDTFHEKLKAKITQLHECLGEYESKEWCGHCIVDSKCAQITMHIIELKKKAETLTFLFGEKGVKTENLMKLQIWREKAEKWDSFKKDAVCRSCDWDLPECHKYRRKLETVKVLLDDICDYYGTETCQEDVCDCDPNGWEGCLTRQILEILEAKNEI